MVAVTFESGGFGAETAAPAARQILAELFGVKAGRRKAGNGAGLMAPPPRPLGARVG